MKLTESDRRLLAALGPESRDVESIADALDEPREGLAERLSAFADNGLVREVGDGRYQRTESGRRLVVTEDGRMDAAIDTSPAIEEAITTADLAPDAADAVRAGYAFLRYWGSATGDEIVDAIYPEWPAGFESAADWWEKIGPALAELPDVTRKDADRSPVERYHYAGTAEVSTPVSDGFLPSERRGHNTYGSVKHAIESLDRSAIEREAVGAAFGVLRHRGEANEAAATADEVAAAAFDAHPAGFEDAGEWWDDLVAPAFEALPGVRRVDGRWRYDQSRTG